MLTHPHSSSWSHLQVEERGLKVYVCSCLLPFKVIIKKSSESTNPNLIKINDENSKLIFCTHHFSQSELTYPFGNQNTKRKDMSIRKDGDLLT